MEETNNESIEKKLAYLNETKGLIKSAIIDKGQEVSDETPFREYVQKIQDIKTSEDLNEVLQTQDNIIAEQQEQINTLLDAFNNKTQGPAKPNIFLQTIEPEKKEGIWLQKTGDIEHIILDKNVVESNTYDTMNTYPITPSNMSYSYEYKNNLYLFGLSEAYKYDVSQNEFIKITGYNPTEFSNITIART